MFTKSRLSRPQNLSSSLAASKKKKEELSRSLKKIGFRDKLLGEQTTRIPLNLKTFVVCIEANLKSLFFDASENYAQDVNNYLKKSLADLQIKLKDRLNYLDEIGPRLNLKTFDEIESLIISEWKYNKVLFACTTIWYSWIFHVQFRLVEDFFTEYNRLADFITAITKFMFSHAIFSLPRLAQALKPYIVPQIITRSDDWKQLCRAKVMPLCCRSERYRIDFSQKPPATDSSSLNPAVFKEKAEPLFNEIKNFIKEYDFKKKCLLLKCCFQIIDKMIYSHQEQMVKNGLAKRVADFGQGERTDCTVWAIYSLRPQQLEASLNYLQLCAGGEDDLTTVFRNLQMTTENMLFITAFQYLSKNAM